MILRTDPQDYVHRDPPDPWIEAFDFLCRRFYQASLRYLIKDFTLNPVEILKLKEAGLEPDQVFFQIKDRYQYMV